MRAIRLTAGRMMVVMACLVWAQDKAEGGLIFYTDRTSFDAANPGLPIEDFSEAVFDPSLFFTFPGPLSSETTNLLFPDGITQQGLVLNTAGGNSLGLGSTSNGNMIFEDNTIPVDTRGDIDTLNLMFPSNDVFAVAADLGVHGFSGTLKPSLVLSINVFGPGDILLGSTTSVGDSEGIGFFGVASDNSAGPITRINIAGRLIDELVLGVGEGVTNVAFGSAASTSAVPEPTSLALLGIGAIGMGIGAARRRRRGKQSVAV